MSLLAYGNACNRKEPNHAARYSRLERAAAYEQRVYEERKQIRELMQVWVEYQPIVNSLKGFSIITKIVAGHLPESITLKTLDIVVGEMKQGVKKSDNGPLLLYTKIQQYLRRMEDILQSPLSFPRKMHHLGRCLELYRDDFEQRTQQQ